MLIPALICTDRQGSVTTLLTGETSRLKSSIVTREDDPQAALSGSGTQWAVSVLYNNLRSA